MKIDIQNVTKRFGAFTALNNISLQIQTGELLALLGPSGCGKTTLLRILAGLEFCDEGSIQFDGQDATGQNVRARRVGFVFQHYALFRHMTVFENIAFGLRVRPRHSRPAQKDIKAKIHELLHLVKLEELASRYPTQLSGGQRQRVALARALAVEPRVLLLDEPFGALDAKVRQELRRWLRRLHDEIHITTIFVTHDQEEALEVADRLVIMNAGKIEQVGTPEAVYHQPASAFVYNFLGNVNLFHGRVDQGTFNFGDMSLQLSKEDSPALADHPEIHTATIFLRPHLLEIEEKPNHKSQFRATIKHINAAGPQVKIELTTAWGDNLLAEMSHERLRELHLQRGLEVYVSFDKRDVFIMPGQEIVEG